MLEYVIVRFNQEITAGKEEWLKGNYQRRSLLEKNLPIESLRFMNNRAIMFYRDNGNNAQGSPVYINQNTFTCLAGYVLSAKFDNNPDTITQQIHHKANSPEKIEGAFGEYQIAHYDGKSLNVFCSKLMTHLAYYREEKDWVAISNRASLTNIPLEKPVKLNVLSQLEMIAYDNIIGNSTAFEGVYCLDMGYYLTLNEGGPLQKTKVNSLWTDKDFGKEEDLFALYDSFKGDLYSYINKLSLLPKQMHIEGGMRYGISGGKDSRLLMTIFAETGILNYFDEAFTYGEPDDPEVLAAKPVAEYFGVPHQVRARSIPKNVYLERLPHHVFQMEGEVNSRTLHGTYMNTRRAEFTGHEFGIKESFTNAYLVKTEESLKEFVAKGIPLDPIQFIKKDAITQMREDIWAQYEESKYWQVTPENFPAYYIYKGRGARWGGKLTSASSVSGPYINLLYADDPIHFTFNIGGENRRRELFHFFTIGYLAPKLLKLPFAYQSWDGETQKIFAKKFDITDQVIRGSAGRAYSWWDQMYQEEDGKRIIQLLEAFRHPAFEDYIDYDHLYKYISQVKMAKGREMLSIFGLITGNALFQAGDITLEARDEQIARILQIEQDMAENKIKVPIPKITLKDYLSIRKNNLLKQKVKTFLGR